MHCVKKVQWNHFMKNLTGTENFYTFKTAINSYTINLLYPFLYNSCYTLNDVTYKYYNNLHVGGSQ